MKKFKSLAIATLAVLATVACQSRDKTEVVQPPVFGQNEKAGAELNSQVVTAINFIPGANGLSGHSTEEIDKAIQDARARGQIDKVEVVVWSDMEYPGEKQNLPRAQVQLAKDRGASIEKYIDRREPSSSISVHNMAERPSALSKIFDTQDKQIKEKLTALGFTPGADNSYDTGRPSTALLMIKVK